MSTGSGGTYRWASPPPTQQQQQPHHGWSAPTSAAPRLHQQQQHPQQQHLQQQHAHHRPATQHNPYHHHIIPTSSHRPSSTHPPPPPPPQTASPPLRTPHFYPSPTAVSAPLQGHQQPKQQHQHQQQRPQQQQPQQTDALEHWGVPEAPKTFPELESLPLPELRALNEENAKFDNFIARHPHHARVEQVVSRLRADVERIEREQQQEEQRIAQRPRPHSGDGNAVGVGGDVVDGEEVEKGEEEEDEVDKLQREVDRLQVEVGDLQRVQDEWFEENSAEKMMARLREALKVSEKEASVLEAKMLSGEMQLDVFLKEYVQCRQKYHERALKLDDLKLESRRNIAFGR